MSVPHLTVAQGDDAVLRQAEAEVAPHLPIDADVREVALLEEVEAALGRWAVRTRLPLGRSKRRSVI